MNLQFSIPRYHYSLKVSEDPRVQRWDSFKHQGKSYLRCEFSIDVLQSLNSPEGIENGCTIKVNESTLITVNESKRISIVKVFPDKILRYHFVKFKLEYSYEEYTDYYFKGILEVPEYLRRGNLMKFNGDDFLSALKGIADKTIGATENEIAGIIESLLNKK